MNVFNKIWFAGLENDTRDTNVAIREMSGKLAMLTVCIQERRFPCFCSLYLQLDTIKNSREAISAIFAEASHQFWPFWSAHFVYLPQCRNCIGAQFSVFMRFAVVMKWARSNSWFHNPNSAFQRHRTMSSLAERECYQLFRVWKTLREMCNDRGYLVNPDMLELSFEGFQTRSELVLAPCTSSIRCSLQPPS